MPGYRTIYGRQYESSPPASKLGLTEVSTYRRLAEALREIRKMVPRHERGLYTHLTESQAYVDERLEKCTPKEPTSKSLF